MVRSLQKRSVVKGMKLTKHFKKSIKVHLEPIGEHMPLHNGRSRPTKTFIFQMLSLI